MARKMLSPDEFNARALRHYEICGAWYGPDWSDEEPGKRVCHFTQDCDTDEKTARRAVLMALRRNVLPAHLQECDGGSDYWPARWPFKQIWTALTTRAILFAANDICSRGACRYVRNCTWELYHAGEDIAKAAQMYARRLAEAATKRRGSLDDWLDDHAQEYSYAMEGVIEAGLSNI